MPGEVSTRVPGWPPSMLTGTRSDRPKDAQYHESCMIHGQLCPISHIIHCLTRQSLDRSLKHACVDRLRSSHFSAGQLVWPRRACLGLLLAHMCTIFDAHVCTSVHPTRVHRTAPHTRRLLMPTFVRTSRSAICRRTNRLRRPIARGRIRERPHASERLQRAPEKSNHASDRPIRRSGRAPREPGRTGGAPHFPTSPRVVLRRNFGGKKVARRGLDLRLSPAKWTRSAAPGCDRAAYEHFFGHIYKEKGCEEESTRDSQPIPRLLR